MRTLAIFFRISSESESTLGFDMIALLDKVRLYVISLFEKHENASLVYHNLSHTRAVVRHTEEIAYHYSLEENQQLRLFIAAWFHDTGHLTGLIKGHEVISAKIMSGFVSTEGVDTEAIEDISYMILSTGILAEPDKLSAKILCDADTYHLGTADFFISDKQVKRELELREGKIPENWDMSTLQFLEKHRFHTEYCRNLLNKGKQANMDILRKRIKELH